MNITCPACRSSIATEDTNVSTDLALCRRCDSTFLFSQLVEQAAFSTLDLTAPPSGAWFEYLAGGFRLGATTRSWQALYLVPFTCVWAGGSLGGIYGTQIRHAKFDQFSSLFGLPFLIGSVVFVSMCAMMIAGKIDLIQQNDQLSIFTGVGVIGWTRTYAWSDFSSVREELGRNSRSWNRVGLIIVLKGKRRVTLGSGWSDERRYFVLSALRQMLRSQSQRSSTIIATSLYR